MSKKASSESSRVPSDGTFQDQDGTFDDQDGTFDDGDGTFDDRDGTFDDPDAAPPRTTHHSPSPNHQTPSAKHNFFLTFEKNKSMKNLSRLLLLSVCALSLTNCKKDELKEPAYGDISVDGVPFKIYYPSLIVRKGATATDDTVYLFKFRSGSIADGQQEVQVAVSYPFNDTTVNGTYTAGAANRKLDPWGTYYYKANGGASAQLNNPTSGSCTVAKSGTDYYNLSFNFKLQNGPAISGTFSGQIQ